MPLQALGVGVATRHLPSGMCCWLDCGVHPDVVGSFQTAKPVKRVGVWFLQILHGLA